MRIRLHKILNEGRTVRFEKPAEEEPVIDVNIIVFRDPRITRHRPE